MMTQTLAQFAIETRTADVPDAALDAAQNAVIDTVGVALAGSLEPVAEIALRWTRELGARPHATVWGQRLATSPAEAAFANGVCSHALDFDDTHPGPRGHASATLVPVAIATGELAGASGEEVLAAYAVALEIGGKIGRALGPGHLARGWHPTATVGIFAATVAAGRLMGLDVSGLCRAWGIAASQMGGLVRNFGTMTKPFHAGHAARCGVVSAWMARAGFTSDAMVQRPHVREVMRKVRRHAIPDSRMYSGIAGYNDVIVTTARGRFEQRVDRVPGSPAWPMTDADRAAKFADCAGRVLGTPGVARLLELCQRCRTLANIRALVQATVPETACERPAVGTG